MSDLILDRPGARIAYDVSGPDDAARTAIAAHGLSSSRANEDASGFFDWSPIAATERLVRYDARGHGRSGGRKEPGDYAWPVLAEDLLALADTVSPGEPVDVVGVSMGVGTALWAAVRSPERFRRLALVIPPTAWATRAGQAEMYRAGARFVEERGLDAFARGMEAVPPHPILEAGGWWPLSPPDIAEDLFPTVFLGAAGTDLPSEAEVAAIDKPVLLLPWAEDPGHPVSTAQRLLELLPHAEMEVARTPDDIRGWGSRIARFLAD